MIREGMTQAEVMKEEATTSCGLQAACLVRRLHSCVRDSCDDGPKLKGCPVGMLRQARGGFLCCCMVYCFCCVITFEITVDGKGSVLGLCTFV